MASASASSSSPYVFPSVFKTFRFKSFTLIFAAAFWSAAAAAEPTAPFAPGDMAVTGFSGVTLPGDGIAPGEDPVDKTFIDTSAPALRIFEQSTFGTPPGVVAPAVKFEVKAQDIGQVFGLAFDEGKDGTAPNLYAAATSAFGLQLVTGDAAAGKRVRLKAGAPGARFMEGQFGSIPGASPGAIWKIDGTTGTVSLLADTAFSGVPNSGPGIGGLAFDPKSRVLYASDLDTGLIHGFTLDQGAADIAQYDHGVAGRAVLGLTTAEDDGKTADVTSPDFKTDDPATWGFTQPERRTRALNVHGGRLYYSVDGGPEIWSVGLNTDGTFASDPRLEVSVKAEEALPVASIAFDAAGRMIIAQRGEQKGPYDYQVFAEGGKAQVLRYKLEEPDNAATPGLWAPEAEEYAIGFPEGNRMSAGGLSAGYAFKADGSIDLGTCGGTLAVGGDALRQNSTLEAELAKGGATAIHGVQLVPSDLVRPQNVPPNQSTFVDFYAQSDDPEARGRTGGIAFLTKCDGTGFPPVADDGGGGFPPVADGGDGGFPPVDGGGGGVTTTPPPVVDDGGDGGTVTPPPVIDEGGGGKTQVGPLSIEKTATAASCDEATPCTFDIKVTNTTAQDVPGPVSLADTMSLAGVATAGKLASGPPAPWQCVAAAGATMTCTHPGPVPANASLQPNLSLGFLPGPLGAATEVKNCVTTSAAAAAQPQPQPNKPIDQDPLLPGTTTKNGLKFELIPVSPICSQNGNCVFQTKITNVGKDEVKGPMDLDLFVTGSQPGVNLQATPELKASKTPPSVSCVFANTNLRCAGAQVTLAPNESLTLENTVKPVFSQSVRFITLSLDGSFGPAAGVSVNSFMPWDGTGNTPIENPVGNRSTTQGSIKTEIKPPASCDPEAGCDWEVIVTNLGAPATGRFFMAVFQGRFDQDANSGAESQIVTLKSASSTPEVPCKGGDDAVTCEAPNLALATNQAVTFKLAIQTKPKVSRLIRPTAVRLSINLSYATGSANNAASAAARLASPGGGAAGGGAQAGAGGAGGGAGGAQGQGGAGAGDAGAGGAGAGAGAGGAEAQPTQACASIPVKKPEPSVSGPLSLLKTGGSCKNNRTCDFTIVVTNTTAAPVTQTVEFDDAITGDGAIFGATAITPAPPAPWTCPKTAQGFKCSANLTIPANASAPPLNLTFDLGAGIGAVKDVKNCATLTGAPTASCATIPLQAPPGPPAAIGPLVVTKTSPVTSCSALGGGCLFNINISNPGPDDFPGPIEFDDETTFLDQKVEVARTTTTPDGWSCKFDKQSTGHCSRAAPLKAGESTDFALSLRPEAQTAAGSIRNCVTVKGGSTGKPVCAEIPLRKENTALLRGEKKLTAGDCKPSCEFLVTVTNVGQATTTEKFSFFDQMLKMGDNKLSPPTGMAAEYTVLSTSNGVTCIGAPNLPVCTAQGVTMQPGGSVGARIAVLAKEPKFVGANCVTVMGPLGDNNQPTRCVNITRDGTGEQQFPNLSITKRAIGAPAEGQDGHCNLKKDCLFVITIKNTGNVDHVGPIKIKDTISLGVPQVIQLGPESSPGFTCTKSQNGAGGGIGGVNDSILCETPGAPSPFKMGEFVPFKPGQTITLGIQVTPGSTWKGNEFMNNCAEILPESADAGPFTTDKRACARTKLDPFAVKVAKTGDQSCRPGSDCRFELDIFNEGPIPHDDPVTVVDGLSGLSTAQIVSLKKIAGKNDFPCKPAPTQIPFNCSGHMRLEVGDHNKYEMIVRLPADAPSTAAFTNCAILGDGGSRSGADGIENSKSNDCHAVTLAPPVATAPPSPSGEPKLQLSKQATVESCTDGGGGCSFAITVRNTGTGAMPGPITIAETIRADGDVAASAAIQSAVQAPWSCSNAGRGRFTCTNPGPLMPGSAQTLNITFKLRPDTGAKAIENCAEVKGAAAPACATIPLGGGGTNGVNTGDGDEVCPRSRPVGDFPNCCPLGTEFRDDACREPKKSEPKKGVCKGDRPVGDFPNCCPVGTEFRDDACREPKKSEPKQGVCKGDRPVGDFPNCCPVGREFRRGACRSTEPQKTEVCKGDRPVGTPPNCCPVGTEFRRGACRSTEPPKPDVCKDDRPVGTPPNCCPVGTQFRRGACRPDKAPEPDIPFKICPNGKKVFGKFSKCPDEKIPVPQQRECPPGYRVLDKPNKYGAYCEIIPVPGPTPTPPPPPPPPPPPKCPAGKPFGTPPNDCCVKDDYNFDKRRCEKLVQPK
jgi:hypothetical protein